MTVVRFKINYREMISKEDLEKSTEYDVLLGSKIVNYLKKFEGTGIYNEIAKAIEFGYHLDDEISNQMELNVDPETKHTPQK